MAFKITATLPVESEAEAPASLEGFEKYIAQYQTAKAAEAEAKAKKDEASKKLLELLGSDKSHETSHGAKVTKVCRNKFDEKAARKANAEIVEAHCTKLDTAALKKAAPDFYAAFETPSSEFVKITIPKNKE